MQENTLSNLGFVLFCTSYNEFFSHSLTPFPQICFLHGKWNFCTCLYISKSPKVGNKSNNLFQQSIVAKHKDFPKTNSTIVLYVSFFSFWNREC